MRIHISEDEAREATKLVKQISPILAAADPEAAGAALASLVAIWFCCHPADERLEVIEAWLDSTEKLTLSFDGLADKVRARMAPSTGSEQ